MKYHSHNHHIHLAHLHIILLIICNCVVKMCLKGKNSSSLPQTIDKKMCIDPEIAWNDNCTYIYYGDYLSMSKPKTDLTILQLNICGMINKQTELYKLLTGENKNKVDVALICETWIRPENQNRVNIAGYNYEGKDRTGKKGGRVGIFLNDQLKYRHRKDLEEGGPCIESLVVELKGNKENTLLTSCYRAPNMDQKNFIEAYQTLLEKLRKCSKNVIIGLDHNMDLLKSSGQKLTNSFFDLNLINGMYPCITKPTRIMHSTATLIDNIFCNQELYRDCKSGIIIDDISDHLPCYTIIESFNPTKNSEQFVYKRKII